jgi:hypothetical protein
MADGHGSEGESLTLRSLLSRRREQAVTLRREPRSSPLGFRLRGGLTPESVGDGPLVKPEYLLDHTLQ